MKHDDIRALLDQMDKQAGASTMSPDVADTLKTYRGIISELLSELEAQQWTSVIKRLPEEGDVCLIVHEQTGDLRLVTYKYSEDDDCLVFADEYWEYDAILWKLATLPTPPKEG